MALKVEHGGPCSRGLSTLAPGPATLPTQWRWEGIKNIIEMDFLWIKLSKNYFSEKR